MGWDGEKQNRQGSRSREPGLGSPDLSKAVDFSLDHYDYKVSDCRVSECAAAVPTLKWQSSHVVVTGLEVLLYVFLMSLI